MSYLNAEQILVIIFLSIWFLFPLGVLVSFIKQSNESHPPKITMQETASDIAHSPAYTPTSEDLDEEELEISPRSPYQIPKPESKSDNYRPQV